MTVEIALPTKVRRLIPRKLASAKLNCGTTFGHSLVNRGMIRALKMGAKPLIDEDSIDAYLASLPAIPARAG